MQVNLAISLHAPNDKIRSSLMKVNDQYPIKDLIKVLDKYIKLTGRRVFHEYIMIKDVNDQAEHARELGKLLQGSLYHVNLIPYNPGPETAIEDKDSMKCSDEKQMRLFQKVLKDYGVPSTVRVSLGQDIDGACGQLSAKN